MPKTITQNWLHYGSESWITKHAGLRVGSSPGNGQSARRRDRRKDVRRLSTDPDLGTRNSGSENCLDPTICSVVVVHYLFPLCASDMCDLYTGSSHIALIFFAIICLVPVEFLGPLRSPCGGFSPPSVRFLRQPVPWSRRPQYEMKNFSASNASASEGCSCTKIFCISEGQCTPWALLIKPRFFVPFPT